MPKTNSRDASARPKANARVILGIVLALLAAGIALSSLVGQLLGSRPMLVDAQHMKFNVALATLAGCAGWALLLSRSRAAVGLGFACVAVMALIGGATLFEHLTHVDLGIDTLFALDASAATTGHPGRASPAICLTLVLAAVAVALTRARSDRAQDLRQFARLAGLAIPLFAASLHAYDPNALNVIEGFEPTSILSAIALGLLLVAVGTDRKTSSLRWNVTFIGVVVLAPLVALTVRFASAERETALSAAGERLSTVARLVAERQSSIIEQTRQMLDFLARSEAVRTSSASCQWELAEFAPVNAWVRALYTVDAEGMVRCAVRTPSGALYVGDRDYVKQALATRRFTISGFIFAKVSGEPRIAIAQPVTYNGVTSLVVASIDVKVMAGSIEGFDDDLESGDTVTLVDSAGLVIARRPQEDGVKPGANLSDATFVSEALATPGRTFEAADIEGRVAIFHARRVLDGAATLIVGASKRGVVRPVDTRLNNQLQLIAAILFCSLALGVIGSETLVVRPLKRLIAYAGRLEAGDFAARPNMRGVAELGALGRALTVSADAIADRERRLVETEALFRGLFDHSSDAEAVLRVHSDGRFTFETWNPAAAEATGLPAEAVIGSEPRDVFLEGEWDVLEADLKDVARVGAVATIEREPTIKGQRSTFEIALVPLKGADGAVERIFLTARNISERKRVERLKNEFVSTVSHELRTPLTSIAGSLGLLAGGASGPLSDRARQLIGIAHTNSLRLVRLINDILDIEKIEAGRMTFDLKSIPVRSVVVQAIGGLRGYADEFDVTIELVGDDEEGPLVYGDEDRLTQVLTNLLSNAVKFSPPGGVVSVSIASEGESAVVLVTDRGAGVPESFRSRMFTKFAQADSSDSRRKGGTGLGLAIVREIVERHGGLITYRSAAGEGTEFEIRLPRHTPRRRFFTPVLTEPPAQQVLVCESDALLAAILAEQLRDAGFEALIADSAMRALAMVGETEFEAILIDLHLPGGDGLGFVQELRRMPKGRDSPLIVVSANAESARIDKRAQGLGVVAWISKPVDAAGLTRTIRQSIAPPATRPAVLHVEDDVDLGRIVAATLAPTAEVTSAHGLAAARRELAGRRFDLVILDVALKDGSGLELLAELGRDPSPTPVIVFSARDAEDDVKNLSEAALTKSRTSLEGLVDEVNRILAERAPSRSEPKSSFG